MVKAIDCATKLNSTHTANLSKNGVSHVGRYLGHSWKGLEKVEVESVKGAGLNIISIFEKASNKLSYFTYAQGKADAIEATGYAEAVGQPHGTAIYFTVDFDAQPNDFGAILDYFKGVRDNLKNYSVGAYGSHYTLCFLKPQNVVKYFFQTVAWSHGLQCDFNHIFQYQCDTTLVGISVDLINLVQGEIGAWGNTVLPTQTKSSTVPQPIQRVKALVVSDIRTSPSHTSGFVRNTVVGEEFDVYSHQGDWHEVGLNCWIDGNGGANLSWIDNPALKQSQPVYYIVRSGDTLSKIATANGVTVNQIVALNGIKNPNAISIGQKLRLK